MHAPLPEFQETPSVHDAADLVRLFDAAFRATENTVLLRAADAWKDARVENAREPLYLPANGHCPFHRIVYAHGFFASALHEVAHWCIAGRARRMQADYGYWYQPDDRDAKQQMEFERVEAKPQALEWAFSIAAGFPFQVSVDNLSGVEFDRAAFQRKVHARLRHHASHGFPPRAQRFIDVLAAHYGQAFRLP